MNCSETVFYIWKDFLVLNTRDWVDSKEKKFWVPTFEISKYSLKYETALMIFSNTPVMD